MRTAKDFDLNAKVCALFVGDPGCGKTSTALHFPGVYILDFDDNLRPAVRHTGKTDYKYDVATLDANDVEIPPAKRYAHVVKCLEVAVTDPTIQTIVIDTLGTAADVFISEVKRQNGKADNAQMTLPDWGHFSYVVRNFFVWLKASGKNVIVNSHNSRTMDEATKTVQLFIGIPGQNKDKLSGLFSDVWVFNSEQKGFGPNAKDVRNVRTIPMNGNDHRGVKNSFNLPATIELNTLIAKIPELLS